MEKQKPKELYNFFFKRKDDEFIFAIDKEKQAFEMFKRKDFKDRFEYIGRSLISSFESKVKEIKKISRKEYIEKIRESIDSGGLSDAGIDELEKIKLNDIISSEVENARLDRTLPRSFDVVDINGNIVADNALLNILRQIR